MKLATYDFECTGLTSFDQILQIAASLTDDNFNENDNINLRCRLMPHIIPTPIAIAVTGISVRQLHQDDNGNLLPSLPEMIGAFLEKIKGWHPNLLFGQNNIGFDRRRLQEALYQCLHDPFILSAMGIGEIDNLKITQAVARFMPDALVIPTKTVDGKTKPVFRLDQLAPANGFTDTNTHDAGVDVAATQHIGRILKNKAAPIWNWAVEFGYKKNVLNFIQTELTFIYCHHQSSTIATYIGNDAKSAACVYNLDVDPNELRGLSDDDLRERLKKDPKPLQTFRPNAGPVLIPSDRLDLYPRAAEIKSDPEFCQRLIALLPQKEYPPSPHIEEQMMEKFYTPRDKRLIEGFHKVPWEKRLTYLEQLKHDKRVYSLGLRLIYMERSDLLNPTIKAAMNIRIAERVTTTDDVPWMTLPKAIKEYNELLANPDYSTKHQLLREHRDANQARLEKELALLADAPNRSPHTYARPMPVP